MTTFGDLIRRNGRAWPTKDAFVELQRRRSWGEFHARSDALGHGFRGLGVAQGDRVAMLATDCIEMAEVFGACAKIGAVRVGLNVRLAAREIAALITDCAPKVIVVQDEYQELFADVSAQLSGQSSKRFGLDVIRRKFTSPETIRFSVSHDASQFEELIARHRTSGELAQTPHDTVMIAYTTGSTGLPKGAVYAHGGFLRSILLTALCEGITADTRWLHAMSAAGIPLMHMMRNLFHAAATVIVGPWDAERALVLIEREKTTNTVLVPTMLNSLLESSALRSHDVSSMRLLGYGASPLPPATIREAMAVFGCPFLQMYGTTELMGMAMMLFPADHERGTTDRPEILASAGKPLPFVDVRIVDERGADVASGEIGELIVRSDVAFDGYWRSPDKDRETIRDGWIHTGDMARQDDEGYVYLSDRAKFRIKTGGFNVFPTEIENVLADHPAINEVAVVGLPDPKWGERIHAVYSLARGATVSAGELKEFCRGKIADFKIPKTFDAWPNLPKGPTGKIQKREIIERCVGKQPATETASATTVIE